MSEARNEVSAQTPSALIQQARKNPEERQERREEKVDLTLSDMFGAERFEEEKLSNFYVHLQSKEPARYLRKIRLQKVTFKCLLHKERKDALCILATKFTASNRPGVEVRFGSIPKDLYRERHSDLVDKEFDLSRAHSVG